jgi:hypothetical protein
MQRDGDCNRTERMLVIAGPLDANHCRQIRLREWDVPAAAGVDCRRTTSNLRREAMVRATMFANRGRRFGFVFAVFTAGRSEIDGHRAVATQA